MNAVHPIFENALRGLTPRTVKVEDIDPYYSTEIHEWLMERNPEHKVVGHDLHYVFTIEDKKFRLIFDHARVKMYVWADLDEEGKFDWFILNLFTIPTGVNALKGFKAILNAYIECY